MWATWGVESVDCGFLAVIDTMDQHSKYTIQHVMSYIGPSFDKLQIRYSGILRYQDLRTISEDISGLDSQVDAYLEPNSASLMLMRNIPDWPKRLRGDCHVSLFITREILLYNVAPILRKLQVIIL